MISTAEKVLPPTPNPRAVDVQDGSAAILNILKEDGCVVVQNVLSPEQVKEMNAEIDIPMAKIQHGSTKNDDRIQDFHGLQTKRLTNLSTHSKIFREFLLDHNVFHEVCDATFRSTAGDYWLNTAQVIDIGPGNKAQPLHRDMSQYPIFADAGTHAAEACLNFFLALTPFTDENGATRCVPGSHLDKDMWDFDHPERTVPAEMGPGDVFLSSGKLSHGGGANRTRDFVRRGVAISIQACYLVPEEASAFYVDLDLVRTMPKRAQQMIGFRSVIPKDSPGLWQKDYKDIAEHLGL